MKSFRPLLLGSFALAIAALPAMAQNENRNTTPGAKAAATNLAQPPAGSDPSNPSKIDRSQPVAPPAGVTGKTN
jgi:hypothetical protein